MSIESINESKRLKKQFDRLGRDGISERAIKLVDSYLAENPEHSYKQITKLIGRFHALYLAIDNQDYWKAIANRGYGPELYDLEKFEKPKQEESEV